MNKPTLRADQIGSILRPRWLVDARAARAAGTLESAALRRIEDSCIRDVVARQEAAGLHAITDGDYRRGAFHIDFLTQLAGIEYRARGFATFQGGAQDGYAPAVFETVGPIAHARDITVEDFAFLRSVTTRVPKITLPSPSFAHCRGGRDAIDRTAYPDLDRFFADLAAAYRAEIAALARAGCRYVQLDEVHYTFFCDPKLSAGLRARGDDPARLTLTYAKLINDSIAGCPDDMIIGVHLCRGNHRSSWVADGGYEPVAEVLFNEIKADRFLLEYDSSRAGGFEPLRFLPKGKIAVLGLVTTKTSELESSDLLRGRIDAAARHAPMDQLAISPQCGFASSVPGNLITPDAQWAKLELCVKVANDLWGSAE
ncbi:MAG: 5-methyltetrahydropteroyltriglutamate--homocysteine S-methyltransferase [Burkholderiales bacterium]